MSRSLKFLRLAKDNICGLDTNGNASCREINRQINLIKKEDSTLKGNKQYMAYYKQHQVGFGKILDCQILIDSVINNNPSKLSSLCDLCLMQFIHSSEIELGFYDGIFLIADAHLNGSWAFPKDVNKGLALYEVIANIDTSCQYYAWYELESSFTKTSFSKMREDCAISAAIFYEYYFKNIPKAIFYYNIARTISVTLKSDFYNAKLDALNRQLK